MFAIPRKEKSAENVVQAYQSVIFADKVGSVAILSDNGIEFKNTTCNKECEELSIKKLFTNPFNHQGNSRIKNVYNFLKRTLTKFLESSDLEWDELLPFVCHYCNIFPRSNGTKPPVFHMFGHESAEG